MRENRTYGSEGGGTETNRFSLPLSSCRRFAAMPGATEPSPVAELFSQSPEDSTFCLPHG